MYLRIIFHDWLENIPMNKKLHYNIRKVGFNSIINIFFYHITASWAGQFLLTGV